MIYEVTDDTFDDVVRNERLPVLFEFYGPWCEPCKKFEPALEAFSDAYTKAVVAKGNVLELSRVCLEFHVMSVPTILALKAGKVVHKFPGIPTYAEMVNRLEEANK